MVHEILYNMKNTGLRGELARVHGPAANGLCDLGELTHVTPPAFSFFYKYRDYQQAFSSGNSEMHALPSLPLK